MYDTVRGWSTGAYRWGGIVCVASTCTVDDLYCTVGKEWREGHSTLVHWCKTSFPILTSGAQWKSSTEISSPTQKGNQEREESDRPHTCTHTRDLVVWVGVPLVSPRCSIVLGPRDFDTSRVGRESHTCGCNMHLLYLQTLLQTGSSLPSLEWNFTSLTPVSLIFRTGPSMSVGETFDI